MPCDRNGNSLPRGALPPPFPERAADDWSPFQDRTGFELADLLYADEQMSAGNINALLEIWAASVSKHNDTPPFSNAAELYSTIDRTTLGQLLFEICMHIRLTSCVAYPGDVAWKHFKMSYSGDTNELPDIPPWMLDEFSVYYRDPREVAVNMISNPDFKSEIDFGPYRTLDATRTRHLRDFMSGEWAWRQAVRDQCTASITILIRFEW